MHQKNKIGRNNKCSCGSGLKFKKCCWATQIRISKIKSEMDSMLNEMHEISEEPYKNKTSANAEIILDYKFIMLGKDPRKLDIRIYGSDLSMDILKVYYKQIKFIAEREQKGPGALVIHIFDTYELDSSAEDYAGCFYRLQWLSEQDILSRVNNNVNVLISIFESQNFRTDLILILTHPVDKENNIYLYYFHKNFLL